MPLRTLFKRSGGLFGRNVGRMLLVSILLLLSFVTVALGLSQSMGQGFTPLAVALVNEDGGLAGRLMVSVLTDQAAYKNVMTTTQMDASRAQAALAEGTLVGMIEVPAGFVEGIVTGENLPAHLYINNAAPLEIMLLSQLARSAEQLVSSGQAGVYAVQDQLHPLALADGPWQAATLGINNVLMSQTLRATKDVYQPSLVPLPQGRLPFAQTMILNYVVFFFLLGGTILHDVLSGDGQPALLRRLFVAGVKPWQMMVVRLAWFLIFFGTLAMVLLILAWQRDLLAITLVGVGGVGVALLFSGCLTLALFAWLGYKRGLLGLIAVALTSLFVGGGLLPSIFLPPFINALAPASPHGLALLLLLPLFGQAAIPLALLGGILCSGVLFYLACQGLKWHASQAGEG